MVHKASHKLGLMELGCNIFYFFQVRIHVHPSACHEYLQVFGGGLAVDDNSHYVMHSSHTIVSSRGLSGASIMAGFCALPMGYRHVDSLLENGSNPFHERRAFRAGVEPAQLHNVPIHREGQPQRARFAKSVLHEDLPRQRRELFALEKVLAMQDGTVYSS